jgi:hypothetical protein
MIPVFISKYKESIPLVEYTFLYEAMFKYQHKLAKFRMGVKMHKMPWKMRSSVGCNDTRIN